MGEPTHYTMRNGGLNSLSSTRLRKQLREHDCAFGMAFYYAVAGGAIYTVLPHGRSIGDYSWLFARWRFFPMCGA